MAERNLSEPGGTALRWSGLLGAGLVPVMPGTVASGLAAGIYLAAAWSLPPTLHALFCLGGVVLFSAITLGDGNRLRRQMDEEDPSEVVSDEMAGMFLTLAGLGHLSPLWAAGLGFLAFRVLDVLKPFGIRRLERLPGGWGILADDLAAGALACGFVWLAGWALALRGVAGLG